LSTRSDDGFLLLFLAPYFVNRTRQQERRNSDELLTINLIQFHLNNFKQAAMRTL